MSLLRILRRRLTVKDCLITNYFRNFIEFKSLTERHPRREKLRRVIKRNSKYLSLLLSLK
jgi:hypothetical protein